MKSKIFYRRHLPHFQPPESAFHVVFRLDGSLPIEVIQKMKQEREQEEKLIAGIRNNQLKHEEWRAHHEAYFEKFDSLLDGSSTDPRWLSEPPVADLVSEAIRYRDGKEYDLFTYCIMPNHVHMVFHVGRVADPTKNRSSNISFGRDSVPSYILAGIIGSLKKYTGLRANRILKRTGAFWQHESYDHVIRNNEELVRTVYYVTNNPVNARLVKSWDLWPWTYCKPGIL